VTIVSLNSRLAPLSDKPTGRSLWGHLCDAGRTKVPWAARLRLTMKLPPSRRNCASQSVTLPSGTTRRGNMVVRAAHVHLELWRARRATEVSSYVLSCSRRQLATLSDKRSRLDTTTARMKRTMAAVQRQTWSRFGFRPSLATTVQSLEAHATRESLGVQSAGSKTW
jgi:hypothetical protein